MANSKQYPNCKNLKERLAELSREQLLKLFAELLEDAPEIGDWLAAAMPAPATAAQPKTAQPKPKQKVDAEVYRRQVHGILHSLDHMRASEAYWHIEGLTGQLEGIEKKAMELLAAGDAYGSKDRSGMPQSKWRISRLTIITLSPRWRTP